MNDRDRPIRQPDARPRLQALDLAALRGIGDGPDGALVCDIDDPDCEVSSDAESGDAAPSHAEPAIDHGEDDTGPARDS